MLCHLSGYPEKIKVGTDISPGEVIAFTGCSGVSKDVCSETTFSAAPHLHVSVLKYEKEAIKDDLLYEDGKTGTSEKTYSWGIDLNYIDPFDYENSWKGRKDK